METLLANAPPGSETEQYKERLRLVKGVLFFRLDAAFKARVWQQRRAIKDLDLALVEAQNRWVRVQRERTTVPTNTGEFASRIAQLQARIDGLQVRLVAMQHRQNDYLGELAATQLQAQKERLATYSVQARFELASLYDRAQDAGDAKKSAPAAPPAATEPKR
jgi:chromosome segregation ATPase